MAPPTDEAMNKAVAFLQLHKAEDIIVEKKPIVLNDGQSLVEAFRFLASGSVRACPVKDANTNEIIGTLAMRDVCPYVLEMHQLQKDAKSQHCQKGAGNVLLNYISSMSIPGKLREMALKRRFVVFPPDATLLELAYELSSGCHIVGISGGDPEQGGLSKVVTQGMLFKVIFPALQELTPICRAIMTKPVISVRFDSKASKAFDIMAQKGISGIAVVDEDGIIIHNTSTSDVKALIMASNLDELSLDLTIEDFLVRLRSVSASASTRVPVSVNKKDDEVRTIVAKLLKTGYHRVWIINSKRKPVSDVLLNLVPFH